MSLLKGKITITGAAAARQAEERDKGLNIVLHSPIVLVRLIIPK